MTIKYKFNKSSEARDCVVESVELICVKEKQCRDGYMEYIRKKDKTFKSPQQLKDYINTIQEPIEFIAESSIDDVLMKEWIGEWELIEKCLCGEHCSKCENKNECLVKNHVYYKTTGSPKLNSNWTFKIQ